MARIAPKTSLSTRNARRRLKPRGKPYYDEIRPGKLALGYYRKAGNAGGSWVARWYLGGGRYKMEPLTGLADDHDGDIADGAKLLDCQQARDEAERRYDLFLRIEAGEPEKPRGGPYTVEHAMTDYLTELERLGQPTKDAKYRINAAILPKLGATDCAKLRTDGLAKWFGDLVKEPPRLRTKKGEAQKHRVVEDKDDDEYQRRRKSAANRTFTVLKAALNLAKRRKKIASDGAWVDLEAYEDVD
ncbi:MAG TPA: hypothetical protein VLX85_09895, partial [Stellaceae bacterium]|nr:hypothetical protein [Stellaceae bacterium]